jgi:hypothetical protein
VKDGKFLHLENTSSVSDRQDALKYTSVMPWCTISTADVTVVVWSVLLPQLLSLAVRLGVAIYVASATLETQICLKGQYGLGVGVLQGGGSGSVVEPYLHIFLSVAFPVLRRLGF